MMGKKKVYLSFLFVLVLLAFGGIRPVNAEAASAYKVNKEYTATISTGQTQTINLKAPKSGYVQLELDIEEASDEDGICDLGYVFFVDGESYQSAADLDAADAFYLETEGKSEDAEDDEEYEEAEEPDDASEEEPEDPVEVFSFGDNKQITEAYTVKKGSQISIQLAALVEEDEEFEPNTLTYSFKVVFTAPKKMEKEVNDTKKKATSLSLKQKTTGIIGPSGKTGVDEDWYVLKASDKGKYRFTLLNSNKEEGSLQYIVYNKKGKILDSDDSSKKKINTKTLSLKKNEKVYIKITGDMALQYTLQSEKNK